MASIKRKEKKPSEIILNKAREKSKGFDYATIGGANQTAVILEILNYLDEQAKEKK